MSKKVSVIIPVWNVEMFLCRCLDSLLSQSYKNFELLLINDGSTDASGMICNEYASRDSRIRVFNKTNEGVSSARNLGIKQSNCDYVTFLDADDWVNESYLESLIRYSEYDLVCTSYSEYPSGNRYIYDFKPINNRNGVQSSLMSYFNKGLRPVWGKLFKLSIIKNYDISFDKNISWGEDALFMIDYIARINSICLLDEILYIYNCENINCISKTKTDIE